MAKFKKDGGKKKNKNSVFKKKVKVGRVIKKANETVPQVKVGKIIIKDQLAKLDDDFVKMPSVSVILLDYKYHVYERAFQLRLSFL